MMWKVISSFVGVVFLIQCIPCLGDDYACGALGTSTPPVASHCRGEEETHAATGSLPESLAAVGPPSESLYSEAVLTSRQQLLRNRSGPIQDTKDPFLAGLLSWFMLGVGQIYAKEYTKGSLFIAAGLLDKVALVLLLSHINNKYGSEEEIVYVDWKTFDSSTRVIIITYLASSIGLRIFCVIDAVQSARKFNQRFYSRDREGFSLSTDGGQVSLQYNLSFSE